MSSDWTRRTLLAGAATVALSDPTHAQAPRSYPRSYQKVIEQARRERRVRIYSAADLKEMQEAIDGFRETYPEVDVDYIHMPSQQVYDRFLEEVLAGEPSADLMFSSAMDLQIKLVNDGHALNHASPEKPNLPPWAIWKNEAYGVTAEPSFLPTTSASCRQPMYRALISSLSAC